MTVTPDLVRVRVHLPSSSITGTNPLTSTELELGFQPENVSVRVVVEERWPGVREPAGVPPDEGTAAGDVEAGGDAEDEGPELASADRPGLDTGTPARLRDGSPDGLDSEHPEQTRSVASAANAKRAYWWGAITPHGGRSWIDSCILSITQRLSETCESDARVGIYTRCSSSCPQECGIPVSSRCHLVSAGSRARAI